MISVTGTMLKIDKKRNDKMGLGKNEIGVDDEIGQQIGERQIEVIQQELDSVFLPNLERARKGKARMEEQWEVDKRIYELTIDGFKTCQPRMAFEENPEYWELQKQKQQWKFDQEIHQHKAMMEQYAQKEAELLENIETARATLKELGVQND